MAARQPSGPPPPPVVQRIRLRYAKRGRLRFSSHRDFARAFERALRRAEVPMAYSAGFHPHPKISYVGAAPTGVGSEAEFVEIALARHCEPELVRAALDAVLPDGLDMVEAIDVANCPPGSLSEAIAASHWQLEIEHDGTLGPAVAALLAQDSVAVDRVTKDGRKSLDARAAVLSISVRPDATPARDTSDRTLGGERAILDLVVRQVTPTVRPDDVLTALETVAGFAPLRPVRATRLAQGPVDDSGVVGDPLRMTEFSH